MAADNQMTAVELKDQGNRMYIARRFDTAIACYSKAIIRNPSVPTFFTNRALCYLKLKQWELAAQDCRRAAEMDRNIVKGHFFLGQALFSLEHYDESISSLQRAHDLAKEQKLNFGDEITSVLRAAKRKRWSISEEKRIQQEIEMQMYLNRLMKEDCERQKNEISEAEKCPESKLEEKLAQIDTAHDKHVSELNSLFATIDDRRQKRDVPDFMCGKISFELMREPVITPSGITYDKKDIEEHLQRVGHFDPVTRTPLTQDQLTPNLAMKDVIDAFVAENDWIEEW